MQNPVIQMTRATPGRTRHEFHQKTFGCQQEAAAAQVCEAQIVQQARLMHFKSLIYVQALVLTNT